MEGKRKTVKRVGGEIKVVEEEIPQPPAGQVLVRTAFSTINPSDMAALMNVKTEGFIYGNEGSGVVQAVGEGVGQELVGKKVAFFSQAWTTHTTKALSQCVILDDSQDLKAAAAAMINPLTACGLLDYVRKNGIKSLIMTAASSQLSKQFYKLSRKDGLEIINIVRKEEQVASLKKDLGSEHVLNSSTESFMADITSAIQKLQPTLIIECLGGDLSGNLLKVMPQKSTLIVLGNLSLKPLQLDSISLIYHSKKAIPFFLWGWLGELSKEEHAQWAKMLTDDLKEGGTIFGSEVAKEVTLEQWKEASQECRNVATQGKILISIQ